ncbi:DUF4250 domain-containing protein [uncultured Clostridium sp.]|uniref:DUF4250 domain-containing protein n=1 Tax=uncultured Clostridium sp. TaxID=59620 RepID=UPI0025CE1649|nr:DUF4250 domain-containing protein [uncultured Clostridium sp.]
MKKIPQDPIMCLSFINTQLRDYYSSLESLCDDLAVDRQELEKKLAEAGYCYDKGQNRFR